MLSLLRVWRSTYAAMLSSCSSLLCYTIHAQLLCVVFADCDLGGACSYVMVTLKYAVLQAIHAQISCIGFSDYILVGVCSCSCAGILLNYAVL